MRSRPARAHTDLLPPPITPTLAWYDPSNASSVGSSAGFVFELADLSASGLHLTASGTERPTTGVNTIGGLNALTCSRGSTHLRTVDFSHAQPLTIFMVIQITQLVGAEQRILASGAAFSVTNAGTWLYAAPLRDGGVDSAVTVDLNPHIVEAVFNGASSSFLLDGTQIAAGNPGATGIESPGIQISLGNGHVGMNGLLGESLFFVSELSTGDRNSTRSYMRSKWGTS